eukprot:SAG22_NODE_741_length_7507_cov_2.893224_2_plen_329_part_00
MAKAVLLVVWALPTMLPIAATGDTAASKFSADGAVTAGGGDGGGGGTAQDGDGGDDDGAVPASSSSTTTSSLLEEVAQLRRQLAAAHRRNGELERALQQPPPHKPQPQPQPQQQLVQCPVPPNVTEVLPAGSYRETCGPCYRFGDSLRCSCYTDSDVDPSAGLLLPRGNMTGLWAVQTSAWDSSTRIRVTTVDIDVKSGVAQFELLCTDGGLMAICMTAQPGQNGTAWHAGRGTVSGSTAAGGAPHRVEVLLDNTQRLVGSADANFTNVSFSNGTLTWRRVPAQVLPCAHPRPPPTQERAVPIARDSRRPPFLMASIDRLLAPPPPLA